MIVENIRDKDIVAYLFSEDVVKFGVVCKVAPAAVNIRCLTKDNDGFWMYKDPIVEVPVEKANIVLNMTNDCSIMGKTTNNLKKVKIIVPQKLVSDLKLMKEELKIMKKRSGTQNLKSQTSNALQTIGEAQEHLEESIAPIEKENNHKMFEEEISEKIIEEKPLLKPAKAVPDSDPEISPVDEETKKVIEEKVSKLSKRPPKLSKKAIAAQKREEVQKLQVLKEKKQRAQNSIKFARNTTTNIRFDPLRLGLGMITKKDKTEEPTIERKMTNEINFNPQDCGSDTVTLANMLNEFIDEVKADSTCKPANFRIASSVPSKSDLDMFLRQLSSLNDWIDNSEVMIDEEKMIAKQGVALWIICCKFLNSQETAALYRMKEDLVAEKTGVVKKADEFKIDKLLHDIRQVMFMLNTLVVHMDELTLKNFYVQKGKLLVSLFDIEAKSSKMYKMFFQYYMQLVDALNVSDDCREPLAEITQRILRNVTFSTDIKTVLDPEQLDPIVFKFFALLSKNQLRISSKYWHNLVSSAGKVIEEMAGDLPARIMSKTDKILFPWIERCCKEEGASLEKAFTLAALKLAMTTTLVDQTLTLKGNQRRSLAPLLKELSTNQHDLPFFICFYQALSQRVTDSAELRALNIAPLTNFISRYISRTEADLLQDLKVKLSFAKELEKNWNTFRDLLQTNEDADMIVTEIIRCINKPEGDLTVKATTSKANKKGGLFAANDASEYETLPDPLETYLFWVNVINEIYLPHMLSSLPDSIKTMKATISQQMKKLRQELSDESRLFLEALVSNFESMPIMSINAAMDLSEVRLRIVVVHLMAQFLLLNHPNEFLSLSSKNTKDLYQRDQLCAYPGPEEERYKVIAQMIYDKEYNGWNSTAGYDVTSLNQCPCGYYYFIGNCGKPYQEYSCPECKNQIGGTGHKYVSEKPQLVTNKDFLKMFGSLEKKSAKSYVVRDLNKVDFSISMRLIFGALNFKLVELFTHSRYLFEFVVGTDGQKKGLAKMLSVEGREVTEYLLNYCKECFKAPVAEFKSEVKAFNWMHGLVRSLPCPESHLQFTKAKRNMYERELSKKIDHFLMNREKILKAVHNKADKEDNEREKRLITNWINYTASLEEFKACFPDLDLRIVTALKTNVVDTKNIDLNEHLNKLIQSSYAEPSVFPLAKYAIQHEELLQNFRLILTSILDLSNHLSEKLDCSITWKEACSLSIHDLITCSQSLIKNEEIEEIVDRYGNDQTLKELFAGFCDQWPKLMQLKDKFPQQLDFRFMCHGNIFSDQTVRELTDPTKAKVAYFLVTESNVESLIINSLLQTLSAFQTNLLKSSIPLFQAINGSKPVKIPTQTAKSADIVELCSLKDLIASSARFSKDSEIPDFNLELLERSIAEEMFMGKPYLSFADSSIQNFNVKFDFGQTFNRIRDIGAVVPQVKLTEDHQRLVNNMVKLNASILFSELQKQVKSLHLRKGQLSALEYLNFEDALICLNDLQTCHVRELYEVVELSLYKKAVRQLDVIFMTEVSPEVKDKTKEALRGNQHLGLLETAIKRLILRQVMNSNSDKLAAMGLKMALEYSDGVVEESQGDVLDDMLSKIDDEVTISQACNFCGIVSSLKN